MPKLSQYRLDDGHVQVPYELDPAVVIEGAPRASVATLWQNPEETAVAGIFRCTRGRTASRSAGTNGLCAPPPQRR
jgi:uncharacterized cupin superfamily protein